jgi:hypothetical protein
MDLGISMIKFVAVLKKALIDHKTKTDGCTALRQTDRRSDGNNHADRKDLQIKSQSAV